MLLLERMMMPEAVSTKSAKEKTVEKANGRSQERGRPFSLGGFEADVMGLQSTIGNRGVGRLLQASSESNGNGIPPIVQNVLRSPGQPLDEKTRTFMESRFGYDFRRVRVHTNKVAVLSARALNADAYAIGRNIVFDAGQYLPKTKPGRRLLAHELAHCIQQGRNTSVAKSTSEVEAEAEKASSLINGESPINIQCSFPARVPLRQCSRRQLRRSRMPGEILSCVREEGGSQNLTRREARRLRDYMRESGQDVITLMRELTAEWRKESIEAMRVLLEQYQKAAFQAAFTDWAREQAERARRSRRRHRREVEPETSGSRERLYRQWAQKGETKMSELRTERTTIYENARNAIQEMMNRSKHFTFAQQDRISELERMVETTVNIARLRGVRTRQAFELRDPTLREQFEDYRQRLQRLEEAKQRRDVAQSELEAANREVRQRRRELRRRRRQLERRHGRRRLRQFDPTLESEPDLRAAHEELLRLQNNLEEAQSRQEAARRKQDDARRAYNALRPIRERRQLRRLQTQTIGRRRFQRLKRFFSLSERERAAEEERFQRTVQERNRQLEAVLPRVTDPDVEESDVFSEQARWDIYRRALKYIEDGFPGFTQERQLQMVLRWYSQINRDRRIMGFPITSVGTYASHGPGQFDVNAPAGNDIWISARPTLDLTLFFGRRSGTNRIFQRVRTRISGIRRTNAMNDVLAKLAYGFFGRGFGSRQILQFMGYGRPRRYRAPQLRRADGTRIMAGLLFENTVEGSRLPDDVRQARNNITQMIEERIRMALQSDYNIVVTGNIFTRGINAGSGQFGRLTMINEGAFSDIINPRTRPARPFRRAELSRLIYPIVSQVVRNDPTIREELLRFIASLIRRRDDITEIESGRRNISVKSGASVTVEHTYQEVKGNQEVTIRVRYIHLRQINPDLDVGALNRCMPIGQVGSTGNAISPHVHMSIEVVENGEVIGWINPIDFFPTTGALERPEEC